MSLIYRIQAYPFRFIIFLLVAVSLCHSDAQLFTSGKNELVLQRRFTAEVSHPVVDDSSFVLAAQRTSRPNPLDSYNRYTGGWNISDQNYWASVGYTAFPLFIVSFVWFVGFGIALVAICCCYCCCSRKTYSYSRIAYALSLILLLLFTCAAIVGCCLLYNSQGKFHKSTQSTLNYVLGQANLTVDNLQNFSSSLSAAKSIDVDHIFLPADVQGRIDSIQKKLNTSANELSSRSSSNADKIHTALDEVQLLLIIVSAVMLLLSFLGLLFSVCGLQFIVYLLMIIGWVLVAGTLILCGVALLFHNVVADTCVAMDDWVHHPHSHTALDDILPCVDTATATESMNRSKEVTFQLVNIVNQALVNISNVDYPPFIPPPLNYNQSGPLAPTLCSPYLPDMKDRACLASEVNLDNASEVWKRFICNTTTVDGKEICTTPGRLTPTLYNQFTSAVRVSHGLYQYSPFLTSLVDCTFVRETFQGISNNNCPGLAQNSNYVYIGLALVSAAVMASLIFWLVYARERRHRKYSKQFISREGQRPLGEHGKV